MVTVNFDNISIGTFFLDNIIATKKSPNGHVWYMPAYMHVSVHVSRVYDWERLVRALQESESQQL